MRCRLVIASMALFSLALLSGCPGKDETKMPENPIRLEKDSKPGDQIKPPDTTVPPPKPGT